MCGSDFHYLHNALCSVQCSVQCSFVRPCQRAKYQHFFFFHFRLTSMHSFHVIRSHTHTSTSLFLICSICSAFGWRGKTKAYTQHTNKTKQNRRYMMSQCHSLQYALGICAICFLLNGISSTEDIVQVQYATASKAAIEPEGKKSF